PRAQPLRIFRIFRARLETLDQALEEIRRVKMIEAYLAPDGFARSTEFVVDYLSPPGHAILLCGLQEFVDGEILNPWSLLNKETFLDHIYHALSCNALEPFGERRDWKLCARAYARRFVDNIKRMIMETGHVPDLAGVGNLIMTAQGAVKLVDINNSTRISPGGKIALDDKGYPVGDKSIEALSLLEEKMVERPVDRTEWIYQTILSPERMANVRMLTDAFQVKAVTG
ncbi:MAG: hypothetical protein KJP07_01665, partial [Desulfatitalea sp.]|nr:hypothetical protein [Desulfatitalea sp.]